MACGGYYGAERSEEIEGERVGGGEGGVYASSLGASAARVEVEGIECAVGFYFGAVACGLLDACVLVGALSGGRGAKEGGVGGFVGFARRGKGCAGYGHVLDGIATVGGEEV